MPEYASGPRYAKTLNMKKFWTLQGSQYARTCLDRTLNISWVLNMAGFWIWQSSGYIQ